MSIVPRGQRRLQRAAGAHLAHVHRKL